MYQVKESTQIFIPKTTFSDAFFFSFFAFSEVDKQSQEAILYQSLF